MDDRRASREHIRSVEVRIHGVGLARVDHEEQLVVSARPSIRSPLASVLPSNNSVHGGGAPFLFPHLRDGGRDVDRADLLVVLELQELVPAVPSHEDEHVRAVVRQEALRTRDGRIVTA